MKEITPLEIARRAGFAKYVERIRQPQEIAKRFWNKVNKHGPIPIHRPELGECWIWISATGGQLPNGISPYGLFNYKGENWGAHRVAYLLTYGEFDLSLNVLHKCDTPLCCRPDHLFLGTQTENIRDAMKKGRWFTPTPQPGESNPQHKLTEQQVKEIRNIYAMGGTSQRKIARMFGVNYRTVNLIVLRINWTHI